jgi:hypothetical protein
MKGEFKHYLFENHGTEKIDFNGTQFITAKIAGKETKRDRAMFVWMAPELNNIPIKIEQWKNGGLKSTVVLESVTYKKDGMTVTLHLADKPEDYD